LRAAIITIGNEILKGKTINSNAAEIGRLLYFSGYEVWRGLMVPDREEDIGQAFREMCSKSDVVVSTGGLGPTFDDITVESFAAEFGFQLVLNKEAYEDIKNRSTAKGLPMTKEREKMAYVPKGAKIIRNTVGTAPGIYMNIGGCKVFILPGVPSEMRAMLDFVGRKIRLENSFYKEESIIVTGIYEATIAPYISDLMKKYGDEVYIKTHPSVSPLSGESHLEIEISAHSDKPEKAEEIISRLKEEIMRISESIHKLK